MIHFSKIINNNRGTPLAYGALTSLVSHQLPARKHVHTCQSSILPLLVRRQSVGCFDTKSFKSIRHIYNDAIPKVAATW